MDFFFYVPIGFIFENWGTFNKQNSAGGKRQHALQFPTLSVPSDTCLFLPPSPQACKAEETHHIYSVPHQTFMHQGQLALTAKPLSNIPFPSHTHTKIQMTRIFCDQTCPSMTLDSTFIPINFSAQRRTVLGQFNREKKVI